MLQSSLSYRSTRKGRAGFTLAELLIVVAIILVLVAIAVPVFTGLVGDSEEATCAANRRTVKSAFAASFTLDSSQDKDALFTQCVTSLKSAKQEKLCPSGGNYTPSFDANGNLTVQCSIHGINMDDEMYTKLVTDFNGNWNQYIGPDGKPLNTDQQTRVAYAKKYGLDSWPALITTDGQKNKYYLQFKSYGKNSDSTFLYAGTNPDPYAQSSLWNARYVCDNAGLIDPANPGQWYELSKDTGLWDTDTEKLKAAINGANPKKVNLVNDKFEYVK